jgi:ParB family transcriptional regulator, chromosome partitioning protein
MQIVNKPIKDLIPYEKNPRRNDEAVKYVANSIKAFGFKVPIVIDNKNVIVAGHTRLKAAKELGMKEVPCIVADDLNEEQIRAFRLADNKTAEMALWDDGLLKYELDGIIDIDMSEFGFIDFEPSRDAIEDGEPDNNEKAEVYVRITFKDAQHFRQYEGGLRSLVDSFEDVKISVGGEDEDKQSDL